MKIYVVTKTIPYEDTFVYGCFSSLELAKNYKKQLEQKKGTYTDVYFSVEEFELDKLED